MAYGDYKSNECTNCTEACSCNSCCEQQECGCKMELDTKCVRYSSYALECIGVVEGDSVETIIKKLNDKLCDLTKDDCTDVGLSLYQLWIDLGNTGTIEDFLTSFNGTDGTNGIDGTDGINGVDGIDGTDGTSIVWLGEFATPPLTPNINEAYRDTNLGGSYIWDGVAWQLIAQDGVDGTDGINGLDGTDGTNGIDGTDGTDGLSFLQGFIDPVPGLGVDGESYLNNTNGDIYLKVGGSWVLTANIFVDTTETGYLFNAAKLSDQVITNATSPIQIEFSDDSSAGRFDEGNNWSTNVWSAPINLVDIVFNYILNFEVNNVSGVGDNIDIKVLNNGTTVYTDTLSVPGGTTDGTIINISGNTPNLTFSATDNVTLEVSIPVGTMSTTLKVGSIFFNTQL